MCRPRATSMLSLTIALFSGTMLLLGLGLPWASVRIRGSSGPSRDAESIWGLEKVRFQLPAFNYEKTYTLIELLSDKYIQAATKIGGFEEALSDWETASFKASDLGWVSAILCFICSAACLVSLFCPPHRGRKCFNLATLTSLPVVVFLSVAVGSYTKTALRVAKIVIVDIANISHYAEDFLLDHTVLSFGLGYVFFCIAACLMLLVTLLSWTVRLPSRELPYNLGYQQGLLAGRHHQLP